MAKTKKKQKKKTRKKKNNSAFTTWAFGEPGSEWRHNVYRYAWTFLTIILVITGSVIGLRSMEKYVLRINAQRQTKMKVQLAKNSPLPRWENGQMKGILRDALIDAVNEYRLQKQDQKRPLAALMAANLKREPWIKELGSIRQLYDGRLVVECKFREPIAIVREHGDTYLIDEDRIVLTAKRLYGKKLIELKGCLSPLPNPGNKIKSMYLKAGMDVLVMINAFDKKISNDSDRLWEELAVLDVSNYNGRLDQNKPHLKLYTRANKVPINWGAAIGEELANYEPDARHKLTTLYLTHKKFGKLEDCSFVELRNHRKDDKIGRG